VSSFVVLRRWCSGPQDALFSRSLSLSPSLRRVSRAPVHTDPPFVFYIPSLSTPVCRYCRAPFVFIPAPHFSFSVTHRHGKLLPSCTVLFLRLLLRAATRCSSLRLAFFLFVLASLSCSVSVCWFELLCALACCWVSLERHAISPSSLHALALPSLLLTRLPCRLICALAVRSLFSSPYLCARHVCILVSH
jgi:hypothetical protein